MGAKAFCSGPHLYWCGTPELLILAFRDSDNDTDNRDNDHGNNQNFHHCLIHLLGT